MCAATYSYCNSGFIFVKLFLVKVANVNLFSNSLRQVPKDVKSQVFVEMLIIHLGGTGDPAEDQVLQVQFVLGWHVPERQDHPGLGVPPAHLTPERARGPTLRPSHVRRRRGRCWWQVG